MTKLIAIMSMSLDGYYDIGIVATGALRLSRVVVRVRYASAGELAGDWFEDLGLLVGVVVTPSSAVPHVRWRS